jgi:hypothetical protein
LEIAEQIEEPSRIIKPLSQEEYPYESYEFVNIQELNEYINKAKTYGIDSLYQKAKSIVRKYNDQDDYKLDLIAADILWSYFQDRFSTTHYLGVIGDNGSGKSTVGDTFESVAYRPVNMTDPTAANLFRVLGTIEPGQCTIIADEAEKIDKSAEIMSILKTGYHIKGKVVRTNLNTFKSEFFNAYCFKIYIAERSPNQISAKGVKNRTFEFNTYNGSPEYDIKEVLNPSGGIGRQRLFDELSDFRKLMLIYRLTHFGDSIADVDIGLDGRNRELCKPLIQLFYNTSIQEEIKSTLQKFIDTKNQRKESTIEAELSPILSELISHDGNEISIARIWNYIPIKIEGRIDEKRDDIYHTADYGPIYRNTISGIMQDKFGAKKKHKEKGNVLIFDPGKVARVARVYDSKISIQIKISLQEQEDGKGNPEGICIRHKAHKPLGSSRYATGQKRCQICEIFIKWDGLWCPCCGYRLRTKPRNLKYKAKLRIKRQKELQMQKAQNENSSNIILHVQ